MIAICLALSFAVLTPSIPRADVGASSGMSGQPEEYRIGPLDKLDITVFGVKDLTFTGQQGAVQVDASGHLLLPLIGSVEAKGMTTAELSSEIAKRLDANLMQNAQVSVVIEESQSQKITVGGAVTEAGVFQLHGQNSTLLQAIAMAKGPSKTADLKHVTVFRTDADGQRSQLSFDAAAIEKGSEPDPQVSGNDVIMVPESRSKGFFQNVIVPAAPLVYILTLIH